MFLSLLFYHSTEKFVSFFPALSLRLLDRWMLCQPAWLPTPHSESFTSEWLFQSKQCCEVSGAQAPRTNRPLTTSAGTHAVHTAKTTCLKRAILMAHTPISYVGHTKYEPFPWHMWSISPCHDLLLTDVIVKAPPYEQGITMDPMNSTGMLVPITTLLRPPASPAP